MFSRGVSRRRHAFTLLEVAVALACSGFIGVAVIAAYAGIVGTIARLRAQSQLPEQGRIAVDYVTTAIRGAGGGPLTPAQALNWADSQTLPDWVAILQPRPLLPIFAVDDVNPGATATLTAQSCDGPLPDTSVQPAYAVLLRADGGALVKILSAATSSTHVCTYTVQQISFGSLNAQITRPKLQDAAIIPVRYRTVSYSAADKALLVDWNESPPEDVQDVVVIAKDVRAFELSFGYDPPERSGSVLRSAASAGCWTHSSTVSVSTCAHAPDDLRAISAAIAIDASSKDQRTGHAVMPSGNALHLPGRIIHISHGTAGFRNGDS